jgi:hypothetical protein
MKKVILSASLILASLTVFSASCGGNDQPNTPPATIDQRDKFVGTWKGDVTFLGEGTPVHNTQIEIVISKVNTNDMNVNIKTYVDYNTPGVFELDRTENLLAKLDEYNNLYMAGDKNYTEYLGNTLFTHYLIFQGNLDSSNLGNNPAGFDITYQAWKNYEWNGNTQEEGGTFYGVITKQ